MKLEQYLEENNAQKQINKLAKKLKNKKVVIYGAGEYFEIIHKNYDLSKLNIVAISDLKFEKENKGSCFGYKSIAPDELKNYDMDVIVMVLVNDIQVANIVDKKILKGSKNEKIHIVPLINPTVKYLFKLFFDLI